MYLSKNSRCVLRKGPWFSSNLFGRNFNVNFMKSRARWPDDDPSKPPLRLNIPKDAACSSYQCDARMTSNGPERANKNCKFSSRWIRSSTLSPEVKCQYSDYNNSDVGGEKGEPSKKSNTNRTLEEEGNSEKLVTQNYIVKSESSESFKSVNHAEQMESDRRKGGKNLKLEEIQSYEDVQPKESEIDDKNGILTIQIALSDQSQGDSKIIKKLSEVNTTEDVMSDDQIGALAEAIVNELRSKDVAEARLNKSNENHNDEAYLVIINVTDKDNAVGSSSSVSDIRLDDLSDNVSSTADTRDTFTSQNLEGYGDCKQVRNLDFTDESGKNMLKRKRERINISNKTWRMKNHHDFPIRPQALFRYIVNGNSERDDIQLNQISLDYFRQYKNEWLRKENKYLNNVDLLKEKEKRRVTFEKNLRKARTEGNCYYPTKKKLEHSKKKGKSNVLSDVSNRIKRSYTQQFTEHRFTRPIEHIPEREMRIRNKIVPETYLEKEIEVFAEGAVNNGEHTISLSTLKPLSKQITLVDELPELLKYPEYKYSVLRKSKDDDRSKLRTRTIRNYHNSCKNCCKLTKGVFGKKPPRFLFRKLEQIHAKNDSHKTVDSAEGDRRAYLPPNVYTLKKEYPMSRLNNSLKTCSDLSDNNIYLQEGNVIGNIVTPTATNNVESTKSTMQTSQRVKGENSKSEEESDEDRYESDISDVGSCRAGRFEGSYGTARPFNKSAAEDEFKLKEVNRVKQFVKLSEDNFEMNADCVYEKENGDHSSHSVSEPHLNSKRDAIINVVKKEVNTPKISDNIANLANEDLAENKGSITVDSLSMMKKVKEIVDLDLKNAEKIFIPTDSDKTVMSEYEDLKIRESLPQKTDSNELRSVVIHEEETNTFHVNPDELRSATENRKRENAIRSEKGISPDGENLQKLGKGEEQFKGDTLGYVDVPKENAKHIMKKGESIIVYDERAKIWKMDFMLLNEKEKESSNKRYEDGTLSEESQNARGIKEGSPAQMSFGKSENMDENIKKKDGECTHTKDQKKVKNDNAKEMDAEEVRKKNSDLYENVFDQHRQKRVEVKKELEEVQNGRKKVDGLERNPSEHYVSKNIVEMSKSNQMDKSKKLKSSKIETVKLNITSAKRPPSKVKEINLNQKLDAEKGSEKKDKPETKENEPKKQDGAFYKDIEKYKTPFTDPEYEEKQVKINSDPDSNPNLKKLESWNKTLVLQEMGKSNENLEGWLKDETDKMATLLLKVLQEAADGNSRRRTAGKAPGKGNPYEAIRKKQENGLIRTKKKESAKKKIVPVNVTKTGNKILGELAQNVMDGRMRKIEQFTRLSDESLARIARAEFFLPKDAFRKIDGSLVGKENVAEDIPGPYFLKKIASLWKFLPELGCQATVFLMISMFSMAKMGLSFLKSDVNKARNDPFGRLFTKYGPIVKIHGILSGDVVLINRPEDISNVFAQAQMSRSILDSLENCRSQVKQKNFPVGITDSCNGTDWDIVRKSTVDVSSKGCLYYYDALRNTNVTLVNRIETIRNKQKQVPDDFILELTKWSMEGLCSILFDKSIGFLEQKNLEIHWVCESERFLRHFHEATTALCQCESRFQLWRFLNTPAINSLNQAYQSLDLIISKYVYQAEVSLRKKKKALTNHKPDTNNTLSFLESVLLNDRMVPDEITANIIDMMLIGVNTTTLALGFLLYNLAQNSRVQRQLLKEVKDLLPNKNSEINYHQLHSLKYLQACLKESMRINIPIPFVLKILPTDISLAQYRLPYGTHMVMDTQMACMKEQNFDEPEKFKPERWLDQDCIHPFSSIPFSNGPRAGFIKHMTEIHLWTCIAKIVRNYQIEYHFGEIKQTGKVISYPDKPLKLTFLERDD